MQRFGPLRVSLSSFLSLRWGFALFFLFSTVFLLVGNPDGSGSQPIAFNHAKHVESGLTCIDCHVGVETQARATLPSLDACLLCHEAALTESAEEEKLRTMAERGEELSWHPVTKMPMHVYFSHRMHVALAEMECVTCHGPMEELTAPPKRPYHDLSMDACIKCHEESEARTDCNDCHR